MNYVNTSGGWGKSCLSCHWRLLGILCFNLVKMQSGQLTEPKTTSGGNLDVNVYYRLGAVGIVHGIAVGVCGVV